MLNLSQHKFLYKIIFLLPFLYAGVFGFKYKCLASEPVTINEVLIGEKGSSGSEFIELFNSTPESIDLKELPLKMHTVNSRGSDTNKTLSFKNKHIKSHEYFLITSADYYEKHSGELEIDATYSASLVSDGAVYISTSASKDTDILDLICWGESQKCPHALIEPQDGFSLERTEEDSWQESFVSGGTPGKANSQKSPPTTYSNKIRINELLPDPETTPEKDSEYVEVYNFDDISIDLSGWKIEDKTGAYDLSGELAGGEYAVFYDTITLNNDGDEIILINPNGETVSRVEYEKVKEGYSYSYKKDDWEWTSQQTPGRENVFDEKKTYLSTVYLSEIFPNPAGEEKIEEYIELYNPASEDVDLSGWILKDSSKTSKYILPELAKVKAEGFLVFYRIEFKFALNNSGTEAVYLLNPNEEIVSSAEYVKSKESASYNFDGEKWRWSKHLTPGEKNKFNNLPSIEVEVDEEAYKNVYANFEVKVNDPDEDKIKVTWDFGDGRKSYKQKTRHKYKETGEYAGSVQIFDGSEEIKEEFVIKVKDFSRPKVRIVSLMPNPKGEDSENEWIMVKNKSKKEVNLLGWSIATGKNAKKMTNHPINEELVIKAGKEKKITREFSKFTLNNKKARIELRYPDGEVAHRAKYKMPDNVKDDEIYEKIKGAGWQWTESMETPEQDGNEAPEEENDETLDHENSEAPDEIEEEFSEDILGKQSEGNKEEIKIIVASYQANKEIASYLTASTGKVLGAAIVSGEGAEYLFTGTAKHFQPDHYAVKFFKNLWQKINQRMNKIIQKSFFEL